MSSLEMLCLAFAAAAAGLINAVAGGGTLITFPVLMLFGVAPVIANATSTVALVIGNAGSVFGFRKQFDAVRPWLGKFVPVSVLGGMLGSYLLTHTSATIFTRLVPYLILFATLLFFAQGAMRRFASREVSGSGQAAGSGTGLWVAVGFQFAVAVYGGYFGAGIGILMLASLGCLGFTDIHHMNALKNVLGLLINLIAATWFIAAGIVDWPRACVMTGGALAGYYLGAHLSQRIAQRQVRGIITGVGTTISVVMFYRQLR